MMLFTSEQVSWGHPDKICDQISDNIVTKCLSQDKHSRCAIETMIKDYHIIIVGELTTNAIIDYESCVKEVLTKIGLPNIDKYIIETYVGKQSVDIALGTNVEVGGAGDQGMMFGYATNETKELMPLPFALATQSLITLKNKKYDFLLPDAKAQVSYDYNSNKIDTFLISTQHIEDISTNEFKPKIEELMHEVADMYGVDGNFKTLVNPTGRFVIGSSFGDSGLTGRKIIADTYGGMCRHGGGAFSGKDPSKVDRSAAYMCRYVAKMIVDKLLASKCEIQVAYAIGIKDPVSIYVNTFGTGKIPDVEIALWVKNNFDFTPQGIINKLDLLNVDYNIVSSYGHFGNKDISWENI